VPASLSARRFFVLQPSNLYSGAQSAAAKAWFKKVLDVDPKAFAHFLYNRNLDGFCPRNVPGDGVQRDAPPMQEGRPVQTVNTDEGQEFTNNIIKDGKRTMSPDGDAGAHIRMR
jgi:hypothetical protein